ncbi:MAG: hypothetical protein Aurels2KO_26540 [Aureliella sp.]
MLRLEVIDFVDHSRSAIVARVPELGTAAIRTGAQLIVAQNQEAIFFRDGRPLDKFGPGRHTLSTANIPILTDLLTIPWEKSPFQACVYFVGKQRFINQGWGTRHPITMRDPDFGVVRLRGFGKYGFRVVDSSLFIGEIVGTAGRVTSREVGDYLRDVVVSGIADLLATSQIGLLQLASSFDELAAAARVKISEQFKKFGLELTDFVINNISPPEEVQKAIDARSSMAAIGDLRSYTLYQAANGLGQPSGASGAASGAAAGASLGAMLSPMLRDAIAGQSGPAPDPSGNVGPDFSGLSTAKNSDPSADIQSAIKQLASASKWKLDSSGAQWTLTIPVGPLRSQTVHVGFDSLDEAGHKVLNIWSACGSAAQSQANLLLEYNSQLIHGAFALQDSASGKELVLRANLLQDTADQLEISRTITSIAWQADRVEAQLYGAESA